MFSEIKPTNGQPVDLDSETIDKYQNHKNIACLNPPSSSNLSNKDYKPNDKDDFEILINECN